MSVTPPSPQVIGRVALPDTGSLCRSKPMTVELPAKVCAIVIQSCLNLSAVTVPVLPLPSVPSVPGPESNHNQRWLAKFGQVDKWSFCLRAASMPRIRSDHDETSPPDPRTGIQG